MPLQRAEGPVFKAHAKRDPGQQGPDIRVHSDLQQNVQLSGQKVAPQKPVPQNAVDPSKDTRKDPRKDLGKDTKKSKHPDAKLPGAKKKKHGVEGICDAFLNTFDCLKWFRATA